MALNLAPRYQAILDDFNLSSPKWEENELTKQREKVDEIEKRLKKKRHSIKETEEELLKENDLLTKKEKAWEIAKKEHERRRIASGFDSQARPPVPSTFIAAMANTASYQASPYQGSTSQSSPYQASPYNSPMEPSSISNKDTPSSSSTPSTLVVPALIPSMYHVSPHPYGAPSCLPSALGNETPSSTSAPPATRKNNEHASVPYVSRYDSPYVSPYPKIDASKPSSSHSEDPLPYLLSTAPTKSAASVLSKLKLRTNNTSMKPEGPNPLSNDAGVSSNFHKEEPTGKVSSSHTRTTRPPSRLQDDDSSVKSSSSRSSKRVRTSVDTYNLKALSGTKIHTPRRFVKAEAGDGTEDWAE